MRSAILLGLLCISSAITGDGNIAPGMSESSTQFVAYLFIVFFGMDVLDFLNGLVK